MPSDHQELRSETSLMLKLKYRRRMEYIFNFARKQRICNFAMSFFFSIYFLWYHSEDTTPVGVSKSFTIDSAQHRCSINATFAL